MPLTTVTPAAASPRAEAARHLEPVRPGPSRADDRDRRRMLLSQRRQPRRVAGEMQDRGRVGGLRERAADSAASWRQTSCSRACVGALAGSVRIEPLERALEVLAPLAGERRQQLVVGEREQLGDVVAVAPRVLDVRRQQRHERRAAQAVRRRRSRRQPLVASAGPVRRGVHRAHAANASSRMTS